MADYSRGHPAEGTRKGGREIRSRMRSTVYTTRRFVCFACNSISDRRTGLGIDWIQNGIDRNSINDPFRKFLREFFVVSGSHVAEEMSN